MAAPDEDPEDLIREGVKLRRRGEDARAEGYFRRANQLAVTPRTEAQLGLVELALHEYLEAEGHLNQALSQRDAWVSEHEKTIEDGRVAARKHLVRVEVAGAPPDAVYSYQGITPTTIGAEGIIYLAAGKPATIRFELPSHKPAVIQVEGAEGDTRGVTVDMPLLAEPAPVAPKNEAPGASTPTGEPLAPAGAAPVSEAGAAPEPAPVDRSPTSPGHAMRVAGIVVGSVGVAAGIVGGVLIGQASSKRDSLMTDIDNGKVSNDTYVSRNNSWMSERTIGVACAVTGGVALVGGVVLYAVGKHQGAGETATVSFVPGSGFGILSYGGSF